MHDPDPKCRHFGILWHFGIFAKKSNKKSNPIFPILADVFRFLDVSRLLDFPVPQLLMSMLSAEGGQELTLRTGQLDNADRLF